MKSFVPKLNTYSRIAALVLLLVLTGLLMHRYSTAVSIQVIEREIRHTNRASLAVFAREIEGFVDALSVAAIRASRDIDVREFRDWTTVQTPFDELQTVRRIQDRLILLSLSMTWNNQLAVYSPTLDRRIAYGSAPFGEEVTLLPEISHGWTYADLPVGEPSTEEQARTTEVFVRHVVDPPWVRGSQATIEDARLVVEAVFSTIEIERMLNSYRTGARNNLHLYHSAHSPIIGDTADPDVVSELHGRLNQHDLSNEGSRIIELSGVSFLVTYVQVPSLDWYLVDAVPIETILAPILRARHIFLQSALFVLVISAVVALYVFRNVHRPIRSLVTAFSEIRRGDYDVRLQTGTNAEFDYLFQEFNHTAAEIQRLIETVYKEKIRSRDALLKQLQAQINPHFLYNSLSYMVSMAKLNRNDAVIEMAHNLSDYYRYTTHVESDIVLLRDELQLTITFLEIHRLRKPGLAVEVRVPDSLLDLLVPRLILQPIAENSVLHGLDRVERSDGAITIKGRQEGDFAFLTVRDNGAGMTQETLSRLRADIELVTANWNSLGLCNVHNRLKFQFGNDCGLSIRSEEGRYTEVELRIRVSAGEA